MNDAFNLLFGVLTGSIGAAMLTAMLTDRRNSRDLAVKFLDKYIEQFDKFAKARTNLATPTKLASPTDRNAVAVMASWFEVVGACYLSGRADRELLDEMHLPEIAARFYQAMSKAQKQEGITLTSAFCAKQLAENYPSLVKLQRGVRPSGY